MRGDVPSALCWGGGGTQEAVADQPSTVSTHTRHECHHTGESGGCGRISPPRLPLIPVMCAIIQGNHQPSTASIYSSIPITCAIRQALVLSPSQSSQHCYLNGGEGTHTAKGVLDAEVLNGLLRVSVPDTHRRKEIS